MKVSIVTEGFQNTGYGHITRCLSLYQAFVEINIFPTLFINGDEKAKEFLEDAEYKLLNWINHPTQLIKQISNSDILIIDSYIAGKDFYDNIIKFCNIPVFIDDNLRIDYPGGIILNGTINSEKFPYPQKQNLIYLLGSSFIPIRKEFWSVEKRRFNQSLSSILITFGGQDIKNLTVPTLKSILENFPSKKIFVVFGSGINDGEKSLLQNNTNIEVFTSISATKMKELMLACDIAVTAAGQTLYELAVTGTPTVAVAVADNQKNNIQEWKKSGFLIDPIFYGDINIFRKINDQIESMNSIRIRKKLSSAGKKNVDGQGSRRVVKFLIEKICSEDNFYLRKATISDSQIVLNLSNDFIVRSQSINKNIISEDEHKLWFNKKINDKDYIFLLAFDRYNNFIGQVRFQIENNSAIVSISIVHEFRGKGLSKKILKSACKKIFTERTDVDYITAFILPSNETSIKAFKSIGFTYDKEDIIKNETFLQFTLNRE